MRVSVGSKQGTTELLNFDVKLVGVMSFDSVYQQGISLGKYQRTKSLTINSLQELKVQ